MNLENEIFKYLDWLRETGITNMFGAGAYIEEAFDLEPDEARRYLRKWMDTFNERSK